jgi:NAD(P)-dependent dehydrogenase (short-subunit alcohol dehydrogenase family)
MQDSVAVITGAGSGLGQAIAQRFLAEGAKVLIADMDEEKAFATVRNAKAVYAGRIAATVVDVGNEDDIERMIATAIDRFGRLDCVVNNAGLASYHPDLTSISRESWLRTFDVLVHGVFYGTKHGSLALRKNEDGGTIINMASIAAFAGGNGPQDYSAAKAAVVNLTMSSAVELAPFRIRVNAICPGPILTPLAVKIRGGDSNIAAAYERIQPWPEFGKPEHVAGAAAFLASNDSRFVTGHALVVDGGLLAAGARASERMAILQRELANAPSNSMGTDANKKR